MRTLRMSLAGTLTVALLGGLGGAVLGQDEEADLMAPATVTGSVVYIGGHQVGERSSGDGVVRESGMISNHKWEASDPRLSGKDTYTGNWRKFRTAGFQVDAATSVLENDDGRWVGTVTRLRSPDNQTETVILHGEDTYEELTAYVLIDYTVRPIEFVAAIFPGDMPPFPEPAE